MAALLTASRTCKLPPVNDGLAREFEALSSGPVSEAPGWSWLRALMYVADTPGEVTQLTDTHGLACTARHYLRRWVLELVCLLQRYPTFQIPLCCESDAESELPLRACVAV